MIGKSLAHYQITAIIGKGGMGEVYRARDTRLERDVALKVLPAEVAADPSRLERFEREAKIIAGLNHQHIVTIHSVEEDQGIRFLTMEFIEGQTTDRIITPEGLPLAKLLDIGIAVADALTVAHEKGIVHRDLKPANVMLSRNGQVKVLDFGLAKATRPAQGSEDDHTLQMELTQQGTILGTTPYMSPEQLRGQDVDGRSDIFALGSVLYELTTGRRPFSGATNNDVISSILRDTPRPIVQVKPNLPPELGRIVARCLEKEPDDRYPSAKDVRNELLELRRSVESGTARIASARRPHRRGAAAATALVLAMIAIFVFTGRDRGTLEQAATAEDRTIAVLPFVNMSPDPDQEYFSDGISEELLNLLSKVSGLRVAARTSSFSFKGQNVEVPEIAKRLGVGYVLEGSVRRAGDQVRVTAQLIQASDGFHVWSQAYDRQVDDIFAIQDEIAADVVRHLEVTLLDKVPTTRKTDLEAYALYLQSVQLSRRTTEEGFKESDALLLRVLEIDSLYAPAWAALAANYANRAVSGMMPPEEGFAKAAAANLRSIAIDPHYAPPHAGLAFIAMYGDGDFSAAAKHLERALELDPTNGRALGNSATLLNLLGRPGEAVAIWEDVALRDPVNINARFNLGTSQLYAGQFDAAIGSFRNVLTLSPQNGIAHYQLGVLMLLKGDGAGALAEFELEPVEVFKMLGLPMAYHALGRKADSDAALAALIAKYETEAAGNIAGVYAFRGALDPAFEWLEREAAAGSTFAEILVDPTYRNLHDDERWLPFLRRVGKAPEQLAKVQFSAAPPA
ncbi:MAG TPA: protein kinase [Candidatus Eisenbacteria bacterium]|nr:protein kinase [Candidatus Eisenbacteria bacterium]